MIMGVELKIGEECKRDRNQDHRKTEESIKDAQGYRGELAAGKS
jgi:hypothetical protein